MDVSIIIPVYNSETYIEQCLKSVLNQKTKYKYEIIVVNDGSTDNSLKILSKYKNHLTIINKDNTGPADSRNLGIKKSTGKYLLFVDSDDYVSKDFVEVMTDNIIKYNADIVICDFYRVKKEKITAVNKGKFHIYYSNNFNEVLLMEFHSCNKIFIREKFIKNLYPVNMFFEDVVAISLNELKSKKILKIENKLYYYRVTENSTTNTLSDKKNDIIKALNIIEPEFIKMGYKQEIEYLYVNNLLVDLIIKLIKGHEQLSKIKEIKKMVLKKFPNCFNNKYIKNNRIPKRAYLFCLKYNLYLIIFIMFRR